jgi:hypothetical protein
MRDRRGPARFPTSAGDSSSRNIAGVIPISSRWGQEVPGVMASNCGNCGVVVEPFGPGLRARDDSHLHFSGTCTGCARDVQWHQTVIGLVGLTPCSARLDPAHRDASTTIPQPWVRPGGDWYSASWTQTGRAAEHKARHMCREPK